MDLQLYLRVFWRFRLLVAAGIVVASSLAFLSFFRVSSDGIEHREKQQWVARGTMFVTQPGFPWGRSVVQPVGSEGFESEDVPEGLKFAEPARFASLAILYSHLATSDPVKKIMLDEGPWPEGGIVEAAPVLASDRGAADALPLIAVAAIAPEPEVAIQLAQREIRAFRAYIEREQRANAVPRADRVSVTVLSQPREAELFVARSVTLPAVVFLAVMIAFLALCFLLENLRPRVKPVAAVPAPPVRDVTRLSA